MLERLERRQPQPHPRPASAVADAVGVPVVASGGAGAPEHLYQVLTDGRADAALAASIFHYDEYGIPTVKAFLAARGVPIRL